MHFRSLVLITLPVLAGCSASYSGHDASWRLVQADRFEKLHGERDFSSALDRLRAAKPGGTGATEPALTGVAAELAHIVAVPQPSLAPPSQPVPQPVARPALQERVPGRKIDQREPPRRDAQQRGFAAGNQSIKILAEAGVGSVQVVAPGTTLSDRTDAVFVRLGIDGKANRPIGPSLHVSGFSTDGELFSKSLMNDGVVPRNAHARAVSVQAFPHLRFTALEKNRDWAFPVRVGLGVGYLDIAHRRAGVDREWLTVGPRLEAEPKVTLLGDARRGLDLAARLTGEVGYGAFREEFQGGDDHDHMPHWSYSAGLGLRWNLGSGAINVGYDFGQTELIGTGTSVFGDHTTQTETQNFYVGGSVRF